MLMLLPVLRCTQVSLAIPARAWLIRRIRVRAPGASGASKESRVDSVDHAAGTAA